VKPFTNPIIRAWNRWFTPQSTDPTVVYRERALRFLLPVFFLLRVPSIINEYLGIAPNLPAPYAPLWITLIFFVVPYFFSFYFLMRKEVGWAGIFFILHWYLIDMLSLPAEGYWYPGYQISLIIQVVLSTLVLPSRAILPFLVFQLTTVGVWGNWLDVNYYDPPLLSSGLPVAVFRRAIVTLGVQEAIILFIVRYLRLEMEKSLRFQQMTIEQLQTEVAERKRVETRIRGILENSPDFISEVDREGTILFASRRADEYEGTQIYRYLSPGSDEQIDAYIAQSYETGKQITFEIQMWEDDGSLQWYSVRIGPIMSDGRVERLVAITTNIHAQKEVELQVKQHAEQLGTIVEIGHAVSTLQNLESVLEIIYQQVQRIAPVDAFYIGLYNKESNRLSFPLTYDMGVCYNEPDTELTPTTALAQAMFTGQPRRIHRTLEEVAELEKNTGDIGNPQRRAGSLLFVPLWDANQVIGGLSVQSYILNAYPDELVETLSGIADQAAIAIQNARLYSNIQQELGERKRAEEVQKRLISELEHKNAELERFTYTVSHDLRSPIVTIKGFVGMLNKDMSENRPDRVQSDIHRIEGAADKMDALLSDLLELSRIGRLVNPPEEIDTVQLIQDALETLDSQIRSSDVKIAVEAKLPVLYGDRIRLREVFENLIGNAIKYMSDQTDPMIEIGVREQETGQVFYIKDNGLGIDMKYHARIFNLFEKLDPTIDGTGIGLALVKRIIEVHNGKIWVESEGVGKGSMFCFTLPDSRNK